MSSGKLRTIFLITLSDGRCFVISEMMENKMMELHNQWRLLILFISINHLITILILPLVSFFPI